MAAASLTSTPPAVDVQSERVTLAEIAKRFTPRWPRMETPALSELSPATPLGVNAGLTLPAALCPAS